ncbi:DUF192 domain-containing protein [Shewanella sp. 3B26]|uniref:DUF192 domain-containing protein n=1 Tax=Shewanella zhuhaiensis TaxID=2919576 RepID=A0AAJ1BE40_9GAMM|nr:DUF192 domain-containing protein [Shewanella zhuhaiensis]MCH4293094.1 DUF192 domain-containing protein [Shewanella zhuhaiensis]
MEKIRLVHKKSGQLIKVLVAKSMFQKLRGLLGLKPLQEGEAMLITRCSSVHTCFMGYPLDLVYLDSELKVTKLVKSIHPWRASSCFQACQVMEFAAGEIDKMALSVGDSFQ